MVNCNKHCRFQSKVQEMKWHKVNDISTETLQINSAYLISEANSDFFELKITNNDPDNTESRYLKGAKGDFGSSNLTQTNSDANDIIATPERDDVDLEQTLFVFVPTATNTGAMTLDIAGTQVDLRVTKGVDAIAGDVIQGRQHLIHKDGSEYIISTGLTTTDKAIVLSAKDQAIIAKNTAQALARGYIYANLQTSNTAAENSTAIQSAIDSAEAQGLNVSIGPGVFDYDTTLNIRKGIFIIGSGYNAWADYPTFGTTKPSNTVLNYTGAGVAIDIKPPTTGSNVLQIIGGGLKDFELRVLSGTHGVKAKTCFGCVFDLYILGGSVSSFDTGVVANAASPRDFVYNELNLYVQNYVGKLLSCDGDAGANTAKNRIRLIGIHRDDHGIDLKNTDSNDLYFVGIFRASPSTKKGIVMHGGADATTASRANQFGWLEPGQGGIQIYGTEDYVVGSTKNIIHKYNTENNFGGASIINVGLGSEITVKEYDGVRHITGGNSDSVFDHNETSAVGATVAAGVGTITTASATLLYKKIGRLVFCQMSVAITDAGTGVQDLRISLPFPPRFDSAFAVSGYDTASGVGISGILTTALGAVIRRSDGSNPCVTGAAIRLTFVYEA